MLRTRLFLNLVPFVALLMAIGVYAVVLFSRLAANVNATVAEHYESVLAAQTMSLALTRMQTGVFLVFEKETDENKRMGEAVFNTNQELFEHNLAVQAQHSALPGEADLTGQLTTNYQVFRAAGARIFNSAQRKEQRALYEQEFYPQLTVINVLLESIHKLNHQAILATSEHAQELTRDMTRLMIAGIVVALLLAGYACVQLSRSILVPIQSLTKATQALGQGQLQQPVRVVSDDELGKLAESFNTMAAQLQAYRRSTTEEILRLHRTMETTLASFPDPIFVLDRAGRVELKNPAAEGLEAALRPGDGLPEGMLAAARQVLETGEDFLPHQFKEALCLRVANHEKHFLPRILAMRHEDALVGVAVVLYDITRFRLMDDLKTNLLATVSHELKTPLTSVRMALHILSEKTVGPLTSQQHDLVSMARTEAERLLGILNDLLDLTRLEDGNARLHKEKVPAATLVRKVTEESRDAVSARNLKLRCAVEPELPEVWVDRQRISHVFTNFISNAVSHSPEGAEILLRAARTTEGGVQFSVIDQGPGIPEEYQVRIFDRFFRVPGQARAGAGLGLSIAREITLAHGGRIGVKSQPGRGSEFFFILAGAAREEQHEEAVAAQAN